jgi:predicted Fe-Mo cluster-binding NifX family protein
MKIAAITQGNQVFQHFWQRPIFVIFSIEGGKIQREKYLMQAATVMLRWEDF